MWITRKRYDELVGAYAKLELAQQVVDQQREDQLAAEKEVVRLTNIIIRLKQQGMTVDPSSMDQAWGSYRFSDVENGAAPEPEMELPKIDLDEAEAVAADRELLAALDGADAE